MIRKHQAITLAALRADAALFACLCIMVLALPFVHPLAEARAAQNGLSDIICTQFGLASNADDPVPIGAADDCPCIILCAGMAAGKIDKTLTPGFAAPDLKPGSSAHARIDVRSDAIPSTARSGQSGIRGPPRSI